MSRYKPPQRQSPNRRVSRAGAPPIANILDLLQPELKAEVLEDAGAALTAAAFVTPAGDPFLAAAPQTRAALEAGLKTAAANRDLADWRGVLARLEPAGVGVRLALAAELARGTDAPSLVLGFAKAIAIQLAMLILNLAADDPGDSELLKLVVDVINDKTKMEIRKVGEGAVNVTAVKRDGDRVRDADPLGDYLAKGAAR